jgi:hypothetical protein
MKPIPSEVLMSVFSLMLLAGCSVKEDRGICPCRLVLDFSEVDTSVIVSADIDVAASDGTVFAAHLQADAFREEYEVQVPRADLQLGIWSGTEGFSLNRGLKIPCGQDSPSVYVHSSALDADCEILRERIIFRKSHCRMTIRMNGSEGAPLGLVIYGNVDGYEADGRPSAGEFMCRAKPDAAGECTVVLPRQVDDSLVLELQDDDKGVKRFALGHYIAESGYDWTLPDLEDITMELDFAVTHITLVIQGWEADYKYNIVI